MRERSFTSIAFELHTTGTMLMYLTTPRQTQALSNLTKVLNTAGVSLFILTDGSCLFRGYAR
jgi:hypothetical protein